MIQRLELVQTAHSPSLIGQVELAGLAELAHPLPSEEYSRVGQGLRSSAAQAQVEQDAQHSSADELVLPVGQLVVRRD